MTLTLALQTSMRSSPTVSDTNSIISAPLIGLFESLNLKWPHLTLNWPQKWPARCLFQWKSKAIAIIHLARCRPGQNPATENNNKEKQLVESDYPINILVIVHHCIITPVCDDLIGQILIGCYNWLNSDCWLVECSWTWVEKNQVFDIVRITFAALIG